MANAAVSPPASPLRIAILEADTPLAQTRAEFGGYGGVFKALLAAAAGRLGWSAEQTLNLSTWDVVGKMEYPELEGVDGILITGSKHTAFENDEWILKLTEFTKKALATGRVRVIGVCFGHQILGRALGARVGRNDEWEISVSKVDLTEKGKELFGGNGELYIHQMHRDIVEDYPEGVESLGTSPVCKVQGMYAAKRLVSVQGHPEFTGKIVQEILEGRHKQGIFDDGLFREAEGRVNKGHDGVAVGAAFLKFMTE